MGTDKKNIKLFIVTDIKEVTMKRQQIDNCIFSNWYHRFKNVTFKSKIIKLPSHFVEYLKEDGIVLPDEQITRYSNSLQGYSDSEDEDGTNVLQVENQQCTSRFPELKKEVERSIYELGGNVFPKLSWSSPRDAAWISHNQSLKCSSFNDICLLLKSSDFISHDLNNAYDNCLDNLDGAHTSQYELVLRRWVEVTPGMEFRCFVKQKKLIRITQRHPFYFSYLKEQRETIFQNISNFYNSNVNGNFPDSEFVFDVFIGANECYLVDLNPFDRVTDSLLPWDELLELNVGEVNGNDVNEVLHLFTEEGGGGIQPSPYLSYAMPKDMIDLSRGEDVNKM